MIVVCDSTILIGLSKIGRLDLLGEVFSRISVPEEVFHEVGEKGEGKPGAAIYPGKPRGPEEEAQGPIGPRG
ncbi:MAG: hypothetical protein JRJ03_17640 [Deltaproteobacteria bacterium]|nr:hypothetical protein [Deltaproteobacteria bacterium]MBW2066734.1 hypothetical protein [Deltaproteobacteria bacterium]